LSPIRNRQSMAAFYAPVSRQGADQAALMPT
jgi:hypothetical protein